jgi:hypothetical protein
VTTTATALNEYTPAVGGTFADAPSQRQVASQKLVRISFEVPDEHAATLRSVVEEISSQVGKAIEDNIYVFEKEHSLTVAASVLGIVRAAVNKKVGQDDPDFAL